MKFKIDNKIKIKGEETTGRVIRYGESGIFCLIYCDHNRALCWYAEDNLELVEGQPSSLLTATQATHPDTTFIGHPDGGREKINDKGLTVFPSCTRKFKTGATRDTIKGKLDYMKALSPIVLRRYVQYLDKHRLQSDGSCRDFDNWKKGVPQETYHSSGGRHFFDTWLLTENYDTEDNHGPVKLEDTLCAQLFNIMGRLHEILKEKLR